MPRTLLAVAALVLVSGAARAQDMPLSQILIEAEGWKKVEGSPAKPKPVNTLDILLPDVWSGAAPAAAIRSPGGGTIYAVIGDHSAVWAYCAGKSGEGRTASAAPYCPLRSGPRGEGHATSLTVDRDSRIYAATEIGVQVFDPTGRLCGVLTPAAPGKPELLAFEDEKLTHWIGNTKYERKLNTTGVK
jgi:hypothetical protein